MSSREEQGPKSALHIVEDVIDLPSGERASALLRACGEDNELLEEALSLLWMSLEVSDVETPAYTPLLERDAEGGNPTQGDLAPGSDSSTDDPEKSAGAAGAQGQSIGPFHILRELGHGGMGTVYLAEQHEPVRRQVAIKVAREWLDESARLRLAAERQAMARLSHVNVARLYEAGATADGHPFFAMEYVDGERLTAYCDSKRLGIEERLQLFLKVCAGVEHAHRHGIIHRDLKPSNILVTEGEDDGPLPKVIDFGIAKATDGRLHEKSLLTGQSIVGTPAYLSPESISAPDSVDTRSDVYSLGVLLQELLIGVRLVPEVEGESAISLLRRVLEDEPPPILRRWRTLEPDLQIEARSARGLDRGDLEAKLKGDLEWIVGRATARSMDERYSSVAELSADIRRHLEHRPVLAGPPDTLYQLRKLVRRNRVTFAFTLLVLLSLVGGFVARTLEADRARRLADEAIRAQDETEEVVKYLTDLFVSADPHKNLGKDPTATELLDRGVERLEGEAFEDRPAIRARLLQTISRVLWRLGRVEPSERLAQEALEIRQQIAPDSDELAESLTFVGVLAGEADDHGRAERLLKQALSLRERTAGPNSPKTAAVLVDLAAALDEGEKVEESLPFAERALEILEGEFGERDPAFLGILNNLANLYVRLDRKDEAEQAYRRSLRLKREVLPPDHPDLALTLVNLGNFLAYHKTDEAVLLFQEARDIEEKVLGPEHPDLALTLNSLGTAHRSLGDWDDARIAFERSHAILEKVRGPDHHHVGVLLHNLGRLAEASGDFATAKTRHRRALEIREAGNAHWATAASSIRLAKVERLLGDPDAAHLLLDQAKTLMDGPSTRHLLVASERGWLALGAKDLTAAETYFQEATQGDARENERSAEAHGEAYKGWAKLALAQGDKTEAEERAQKSIEALETVFAPTHSSVVEARALLAEIRRGD
ncbi:MAG: serine/threonine-protein kinase [Acidobacteriota bacterium]